MPLGRARQRRASRAHRRSRRRSTSTDPATAIARWSISSGARTLSWRRRCARTTRCSAHSRSIARRSGRSPTSRSRCCRISPRRRSSRWRMRGSSPRRARPWSSRPRPPRCCRSSTPRPATSRRCSTRCWKRRTRCAAPPVAACRLWDGEKFRGVAMRGFTQSMVELLRQGYQPESEHAVPARSVDGERVVHIADIELAEIDESGARAGGVELGGIRTILLCGAAQGRRLARADRRRLPPGGAAVLRKADRARCRISRRRR